MRDVATGATASRPATVTLGHVGQPRCRVFDPFGFDIARSPNRHVTRLRRPCLPREPCAHGMCGWLPASRGSRRSRRARSVEPNNRLLGIRHMLLSIRFRGRAAGLPLPKVGEDGGERGDYDLLDKWVPPHPLPSWREREGPANARPVQTAIQARFSPHWSIRADGAPDSSGLRQLRAPASVAGGQHDRGGEASAAATSSPRATLSVRVRRCEHKTHAGGGTA
jgi:hypothetical protein